MNVSATNIRDYGYRKIKTIFERDSEFYKNANKIAYMLSSIKYSSFTMLLKWDLLSNKGIPHLRGLQEIVDTNYTEVESVASRKHFSKVYTSHFKRYAKAVNLSEAETDLLLKLSILIPIVFAGLTKGATLSEFTSFFDEDIAPIDSVTQIGLIASYLNCIISWGLILDKDKERTDNLLELLILTDNSDFVDLVYRGQI